MSEPIDIRGGRNAAQLVALAAPVGAMPDVLRAKGALSDAELETILGAADDPAAARLVVTVKALMVGVGDRRNRGPGFADQPSRRSPPLRRAAPRA